MESEAQARLLSLHNMSHLSCWTTAVPGNRRSLCWKHTFARLTLPHTHALEGDVIATHCDPFFALFPVVACWTFSGSAFLSAVFCLEWKLRSKQWKHQRWCEGGRRESSRREEKKRAIWSLNWLFKFSLSGPLRLLWCLSSVDCETKHFSWCVKRSLLREKKSVDIFKSTMNLSAMAHLSLARLNNDNSLFPTFHKECVCSVKLEDGKNLHCMSAINIMAFQS